MPVIQFLSENIFTIIWVIITMLVTSMIAFVTVLKLEEEVVARKKAEKEVKKNLSQVRKLNTVVEKQKTKLQAILSSMGEGLIVLDEKGKVQMINHVAGGLLRQVPENLIGKNLFNLVLFDYEDRIKKRPIKEIIFDIVNNPDIVNISVADRLYCQLGKGKRVPVTMVIAPLMHDYEVNKMVVILIKDASVEASLDQAKIEFVSLASHQLRTPLSTMSWYAEMMLDGDAGKLTKKQKEFLHEIHASNKRMTELVNSLLNVSRVELGTYAVNPEPTKIQDVAKSMLIELLPQMENKKIKLIKSVAKNIPKINIDPSLVRIIFQNLLTNAIKYAPDDSEVDLKLSLKKGKSKRTSVVKIEVTDNGYGIPKDEQPKIFTKLFRATNAQKKSADGNGLGLYLVKQIVDHADGKIWFESQENKGTTFYVELPLSGMKKKEGTKSLS